MASPAASASTSAAIGRRANGCKACPLSASSLARVSSCVRRCVALGFVGGGQRDLGLRLERGQRRAQFVRGIGGEAALVLEGPVDAGEEFVQALHQRQDLARRVAVGDRRQPVRRACRDVVGDAAQGPQRNADRDQQHQGQSRQGVEHRRQQVLRNFAGEVGALLLHVAGGGGRMVEQFLDLVQR
jgi:hypothetical protein